MNEIGSGGGYGFKVGQDKVTYTVCTTTYYTSNGFSEPVIDTKEETKSELAQNPSVTNSNNGITKIEVKNIKNFKWIRYKWVEPSEYEKIVNEAKKLNNRIKNNINIYNNDYKKFCHNENLIKTKINLTNGYKSQIKICQSYYNSMSAAASYVSNGANKVESGLNMLKVSSSVSINKLKNSYPVVETRLKTLSSDITNNSNTISRVCGSMVGKINTMLAEADDYINDMRTYERLLTELEERISGDLKEYNKLADQLDKEKLSFKKQEHSIDPRLSSITEYYVHGGTITSYDFVEHDNILDDFESNVGNLVYYDNVTPFKG